MKALTWQSRGKITCETVPDPKIEHGRDVIIKVTACAICGSDLHLMGGFMPTMECGDILGHETMGEVIEVGRDNHKLKVGDRVVVPGMGLGEGRDHDEERHDPKDRSEPSQQGAGASHHGQRVSHLRDRDSGARTRRRTSTIRGPAPGQKTHSLRARLRRPETTAGGSL